MASGPQDFVGQASGFYSGQKEADRITRKGAADRAKSKVDQVDPYYSQLFEDLNSNQGKAQSGLVSSMARRGLTRSGIRTKAEGNLAGEYGKMGERLGTEQRTAKTEAEGAYNSANDLLNNLDLEYQDKINQMASQLYKDWKAAEDTRIYNEQQLAIARSQGGGGGGGGATSDWVDALEADIGKYVATDRHYKFTGDTEARAIPQLVAKYAKYGVTKDQVADMLYGMRKQYETPGQDRSVGTAVNWQGGKYDSWLM